MIVDKIHHALVESLKDSDKDIFNTNQTEILIHSCQRHRLLLSDVCNLNHITKDGLEKWKDFYKNWTVKSLRLLAILIDLNNNSEFFDTSIIPLKGPVLSFTLYKNKGGRIFRDLDILVKHENLDKLKKEIRVLGYELDYPRKNLSLKQWNRYFKYRKEIGLINRTDGTIIELHTGIYFHHLLRESEERIFFEDLTKEDIAGTPMLCMNRDNTFLYLAYHGGWHLYFRLFWLRDIAEALKRWELDHLKILNNAKTLGIERLLGVSLELAREYFGSEIPRIYSEYLAEDASVLKRLQRLCTKAILGPEIPKLKGKIERLYFFLLLKPGLRYKWAVTISLYQRWYIRKFYDGN